MAIVTISVAEYEALQRDSRKLRAIRDKMDEYHIRKRLVEHNLLHRLRRKTLNEIAALLHRKDI